MKQPVLSEQDLAAKVVDWLKAEGWEVFEEVELPGGRADIVATRNGHVWIVEAKMKLSAHLIAQARRHKDSANQVSVAIPYARPSDGRDALLQLLQLDGIGAIEVRAVWPVDAHLYREVKALYAPSTRGRAYPRTLEALRPEMQEGGGYARAGASGGGQFTRYKQTCAAIAKYATEHPGAALREALSKVDHHYASIASGVSSLRTWATKGKVHGFRLVEDGEVVRVFPTADGIEAEGG